MKGLSLFILLIMNFLVYGQTTFPKGCNPVAVEGETIKLNIKEPVVFLINNDSDSVLWVTHPVDNPSASAGWSSQLEKKRWSALLVDKNKFELSCIESKPGHEQQIPCEGMLSICEWSKLKIPPVAKGTFWVAENMSLNALINHLGGKGFVR